MAKKFKDCVISDRVEFEYLVPWEDIKKFAETTGDGNRLHVDREFAARAFFKDIVAHRMLGASFVSTIIGKYQPGAEIGECALIAPGAVVSEVTKDHGVYVGNPARFMWPSS